MTILLFAGLSDHFGQPRIVLEGLNETITVAQIKSAIMERYPSCEAIVKPCFIAVNQAYAEPDQLVRPGDELALIPPVSGGDCSSSPAVSEPLEQQLYQLTEDTIDVQQVVNRVIVPEHGASLVFVGTTREYTDGQRTVLLEYEAYKPMALKTLKQIGEEIDKQWPSTLTAITHRLGKVEIGEASVVIAVSAPHRASCYEASRYAIERLKQIVPIWKKEIWEDGSIWKGHQLGPWNPTAAGGGIE